jgi:4-amino-4-deoxy-L-arabinose transferase-like glycosyltransferase
MSQLVEQSPKISPQKKAGIFDLPLNRAFFKEHYATFLLLLIVTLALFLRVYNLSTNPGGFDQDETSNGVDAYSLGRTLRDHHGNFLPLLLESFEDWPSPLLTYLTIPFVWTLGLSEFAVRLPVALLGTGAVVMLFFLVKRFTGKKELGLLAALFLAIMPWAIMTSRWGIPPGSVTFFLFVFLYAFSWASETPAPRLWKFGLVGLSAGVMAYAYPTQKMFIPLLLGALFLIDLVTRLPWRVLLKKYLVIGGIYLLLTGPVYIMILLDPVKYNGRFNAISVLQKAPEPIVAFLAHYLNYLLPGFYFETDTGLIGFNVPGIETTYNFLAPLYYMGIVLCVVAVFSKKPFLLGKRTSLLLLAWWLLFPIAASLTMDPFHLLRIIHGMPLLIIFPVVTLGTFLNLVTSKKWLTLCYGVIVAVATFYLVVFSLKYFEDYPSLSSEYFFYGTRQYSEYLLQNEAKFTSVKVDISINEPYINYLFYSKLDPGQYDYAAINATVYDKGDLLYVPKYGKYIFDYVTPEDLAGATEIYTVENYGRAYYRIYAKGTNWYVIRVIEGILPEYRWN